MSEGEDASVRQTGGARGVAYQNDGQPGDLQIAGRPHASTAPAAMDALEALDANAPSMDATAVLHGTLNVQVRSVCCIVYRIRPILTRSWLQQAPRQAPAVCPSPPLDAAPEDAPPHQPAPAMVHASSSSRTTAHSAPAPAPRLGRELILKARLVRRINTSGTSAPPRRPRLVLSDKALWYGLLMLDKAGGGMKHTVKADNAYERRLLTEVVGPEESGFGFAEVGAMEEAKDALREAVQLPLQCPQLFVRGSLARPCRGVLLFGPPGTGKTLLARAAAAECGASFLAVSPSTVASKWLGDGVRYVRAVFSLAAKLAPCVVFVDEVDAILGVWLFWYIAVNFNTSHV